MHSVSACSEQRLPEIQQVVAVREFVLLLLLLLTVDMEFQCGDEDLDE